MQPNVWIFHANPKIYRLSAAVVRLKEISWVVRQNEHDIGPGDKVYLWEGGNNAGIVAVGEVIRGPARLEDEDDEKEFYASRPEEFLGPQLRVRIKLTHVLTKRLTKAEMKTDEILRNHTIVKMRIPRETNYRVKAQEAWALDRLIIARSVVAAKPECSFW